MFPATPCEHMNRNGAINLISMTRVVTIHLAINTFDTFTSIRCDSCKDKVGVKLNPFTYN